MIEKILRDIVRDAVIEAVSAVIETHAPRLAAITAADAGIPASPCAGHAVESAKDEAAEKKPARAKKEKPAPEAPSAAPAASEDAPPAQVTPEAPAPLPAPATAPSIFMAPALAADRAAMREIIAKLPGGIVEARKVIVKRGPKFDDLDDDARAAVLAELRLIIEAGF